MTLKNLEGQSRLEIAKALPGVIKSVMASYNAFSAQKIDKESDAFKKYQDACKAAAAHIELLTKLVDWLEAGKEEIADETLMTQLIESAKEIREYEGKANE